MYVGNIPFDSTERDLVVFFQRYGKIDEIFMKNGYAFVEFDDFRDAEDAVCDMNDRKLLGRRVTVEIARGKPRLRGDRRKGPPVRTNYRLIVENLSSRATWRDLKKHMRRGGDVTYADAHHFRRNEGIVEFATYGDMKCAMEKMSNTELNGRRIRLVEDDRVKNKYSFRSRSRSISESRKRKRSFSNDRSLERFVRRRSESRSSRSRSTSRPKRY